MKKWKKYISTLFLFIFTGVTLFLAIASTFNAEARHGLGEAFETTLIAHRIGGNTRAAKIIVDMVEKE